jgi:hypothetical protein
MASSGLEVQKSIHAALTGDAVLTGLLGGPRVYDDVPRGAEYPYLTFGQSTLRDWSTGLEEGHEHLLTLHVWSRANGQREAHEIMSAVEAVLHDTALTVTGHHLVNLRHEFSDAMRDADGETYHGILRYRAVTEPV